jgi:hypothetical protein
MPISPRSAGTAERLAAAEAVAIAAVHFLALEIERLQRFLDLSGTTPDALRERLAEPGFLAGVLDHLLGDERLLLDFAAWAELPPAEAAQARRTLLGGLGDDEDAG